MLRPAYEVKIGSDSYGPSARTPLLGIIVDLAMDIPNDSATIALGPTDKASSTKKGETVSIGLGYDDKLVDVFKGEIFNVEPNVSSVRLLALNSVSRLLKKRTNQVFENQSAGDIVKDLAKKAQVKTKDVSSGLSFPMYVVDDSKSVYDHIKDLALKCGFDVYMTPDDSLVFKKYERSKAHLLEYGKNIIEADFDDETSITEGVIVQGESPSSFKGASTSHWISKRRVEAMSGKGDYAWIRDPTIKDQDTASKMVNAQLGELSRTFSGTVKTIGMPAVKLGDTIEVKKMKNSKLNGEFQVRGVEHLLSKSAGFVSTVGWRK